MFTVAFILISYVFFVFFAPCGCSLSFIPLLASNGSSLCAVEDPFYVMNTDDIIGIPPGVPGSVRCSFYCTGMRSKTNCSGFNYLIRGPTSGKCQFYSEPPSNCSALIKGCMFIEVNNRYFSFYYLSLSSVDTVVLILQHFNDTIKYPANTVTKM